MSRINTKQQRARERERERESESERERERACLRLMMYLNMEIITITSEYGMSTLHKEDDNISRSAIGFLQVTCQSSQ
jgi:hypothetical protein